MLADKKIENIKKLSDRDWLRIEQEKVYAEPDDITLIPKLVKLAREDKFKILPLGNGSKIDLSVFSKEELLFLRLNRFFRTKKVVPQDLYVVVEPGLNLGELNPGLSEHKLFYPLSREDSSGTVGGSVAAGLSARAGKKEVSTKDMVLALEIINSSGQLLKTGSEVFKSVTGYDTTRLLVGSWGSLGVITSVSLRVFPLSRKKEFDELKTLPARPGRLKGEKEPGTILNRRIKKLLDPEGVFAEIF